MSDGFEDLEQIVNAGVRHVKAEMAAKRTKTERRSINAADEETARVRWLYANPENWQRGRVVALIHQDTETLLGNFVELLHKTEANCRRLVREPGLTSISGIEYMSGSWWLPEEDRPEPRRSDHILRSVVLHVYLDKMQMHCPGCQVDVLISYGAIARIELPVQTMFAAVSGRQEFIMFPAGTNIQPEMSHDSRVALRVELAL